MRTLIFGCGYLGERVAALWKSGGHDICVVSRSEQRASEFTASGYEAVVADVTDASSLKNLPATDAVLFAVGYDRTSDHSIEQVYAGGVRNVLSCLPAGTKRFVYISTTGVYGNADGGWVDEQTPPDPARPGGKASLAAEEAIRASPFAEQAVLLRLAGIYGPGRLPYLKQLTAGEPIEAPQEGYLNLIHVDDAANIVVRVANPSFEPIGPEILCVSDGHPVVRRDYYQEVAAKLGAPEPKFKAPAPDSPRAARAAADKRISNQRLCKRIEFAWQFPSYREGLVQILAATE